MLYDSLFCTFRYHDISGITSFQFRIDQKTMENRPCFNALSPPLPPSSLPAIPLTCLAPHPPSPRTRILRHQAPSLGLRMSADGFVLVADLLALAGVTTQAGRALGSHSVEDVRRVSGTGRGTARG